MPTHRVYPLRSPLENPAILRVSFRLLLRVPPAFAADSPTLDYTRDIRPILADKCYACHGPDAAKRKAKLRLDQRDIAVKVAIKPGDAANSALLQRVSSKDAYEMMPPPESKKPPCASAQIDLLN